MATEEAIAAGLIDWVNSLAVANPVYTVEDLSNGHVIWKVLQQIDRFSFSGKLPEDPDTDQWINKWTNLKHIYDALSIFLLEDCGQRLPLPGGRPDLKAIAQSSSLTDIVTLLKLLVVAAINCAERIEFLKQMQQLAESTQEVLMQTVQEAGEGEAEAEGDSQDETQDLDQHDPVASDHAPTSPRRSVEVDSVLASEERLGKVIADNQRIAHEKRELQKHLDDFHLRYEKLQERCDLAQDELKETGDRLSAVLAGRSDISTRPLDAKHDTLIATLENRVEEAESEVDELRKANEVLKIKSEKAQKLQDDYDEMKIERDRLARKANTAEKYRQKLEASQDLEKDNATLRIKVNDLQNQLKQSDSAQASSSDLQREVDEYRRLLPSIEQERYELNEMKKRLEFDYHTLEVRYHDTSEQLSRQHQAVEDLQSRLADYEDGIAPATREERLPSPVDKDLDHEEADFLESEARLAAALFNGDSSPGDQAEMTSPTSSTATPSTSALLLDLGTGDNESITEDELKAIMAAMRAQAQAGSASERESSLRAQKKLVVAIERQRTKNKLLLDHIQKQDGVIRDLQQTQSDRPQAETEKKPNQEPVPPPPPPKDTPRDVEPAVYNSEEDMPELERLTDENRNLQRELKLMASAWYEQNQRLASLSSAASGRSRGYGGGGPGNGAEFRGFLGRQRRRVDVVTFAR
ncbi:uncharacterized protein A1O9_12643 [Exophiala aquamarina CBS 119918]|uniref:HOOK N-terminal domain-containing protein n=1 Tax=Exophiala aquamarina CBS 119918 TaxID=1182545 RepID=A0A072NWB6_9EURO|nr:uncharacterized protein A1O9_12643 [Exophiala aquamarina CBS 119918]KEF51293.1 hypothetical protein A1O9_12643 [Exophiala aquamarina CBS 119918]